MNEAAAHVELPALPVTARWARRHVEVVLGAWQLPSETIETAELLVSELVTNTLGTFPAPPPQRSHSSRDGTERMSLTLRLLHGRVVIEVSDNDPNPPVLTYADADAESGRGLMLVQALSKEWGYRCLPSGGKVVFAVLGVPPVIGPQE